MPCRRCRPLQSTAEVAWKCRHAAARHHGGTHRQSRVSNSLSIAPSRCCVGACSTASSESCHRAAALQFNVVNCAGVRAVATIAGKSLYSCVIIKVCVYRKAHIQRFSLLTLICFGSSLHFDARCCCRESRARGRANCLPDFRMQDIPR